MPVVENASQPPGTDSDVKDEEGDNAPSSTTTNTEIKIEIVDEELAKSPEEEAEIILESPKLSPDSNDVTTNGTKPLQNNETPLLENASKIEVLMEVENVKDEVKIEETSKTSNVEDTCAVAQTSLQHTASATLPEGQEQDKSEAVKPKDTKDNEEELAELMRASSTIVLPTPRKPVYATNKRTRLAKEVEATLTLLKSGIDPETRGKREHEIALGYLTKVQQVLNKDGETGEAQFRNFIEILRGAEEVLQQAGGVAKLYSQVCEALVGYEQLASEFLIFLEPGQALACNSFSQHQQLTAMMDFISKIQVHFHRQPSMVRMLVNTLTSLAERSEVTGEEVQAAVLPLLKGVPPLLTECFLRLLPSSKPPESWMDEYSELMYDDLVDDQEPVDTLNLPLEHTKDDTCVCTCHQQQQEELVTSKLKARTDHCVRCGLKFIHGKVFVHNGRCLRSARITFLNEDMDSAIKRLTVHSTTGRSSLAKCRKRNGNSFSQDSTNVKDSPPPKLINEESDNEYNENVKNFSSPKSSRKKRKTKHIFSAVVSKSEKLIRKVKVPSPNEAKRLSSPNTSSSCDALHESRKSEEQPAEPDSTVPCDEEQVESSKQLPEEQVEVEQNVCEEEKRVSKEEKKTNVGDNEEKRSREEQNIDTCEELDEGEEERRGSRESQEEQNRDTCEEIDEDEEDERGSQEEQNRDTCEELDDEDDEDEEEERESRGSREEQNRDTCEELDEDEEEERASRGSREEQNRDTCEELDEDEEEERGSRGSREEQNRDTCEELDEDEEEERGSRGSREEQNRDTCEELEDEELELELEEEEESRRLGNRDICEELGEEEEEEEELDLDLELDEEEESREQGAEASEEPCDELGEEPCEELGEEQELEELGEEEEEEEEMEVDEEVEDEELDEEEQYFDECSQETEDTELQEEPSSSVGSPDKDPCWTRDEDKAILQAFQQGGTAQRMLLTVRQLLPERTPDQIMSRFHILLKLLQQMSSAARENNRK